jgi:hypothetical protein
LVREARVPGAVVPNNTKELTEDQFKGKRKALRTITDIHPIEANTPIADLAEHGIHYPKRTYQQMMLSKNSVKSLLDLCLQCAAAVR